MSTPLMVTSSGSASEAKLMLKLDEMSPKDALRVGINTRHDQQTFVVQTAAYLLAGAGAKVTVLDFNEKVGSTITPNPMLNGAAILFDGAIQMALR